MVNQLFSFSKKERIVDPRDICRLFQRGSCFIAFPYKVFYLKIDKSVDLVWHRVIFSIPKKRVPSAVKRNKVKRLSREAYRLNKPLVFDQVDNKNKPLLLIGFVYMAHHVIHSFDAFRHAMIVALQRIQKGM